MSNIEFVKKLYNGKNCYSDHMSEEELNLLHIKSAVEDIIAKKLSDNKIIFLTGNPGDGKTFIIKSIQDRIPVGTYIETDLNTVSDYTTVAQKIISCIENNLPAIIAVNEYPFFQLIREIKRCNEKIGRRTIDAQRSSIVYNSPVGETENQILVIDLNERNLLESNDPNKNLPLLILENLCNLLQSDGSHNTALINNINALSREYVKLKLIELIDNAIISTEHFAVRDIMGAFAFMLTSCLDEERMYPTYYDALFNGKNPLLRSIQQFDPIFLTIHSLDESLWNGEDSVKCGWLVDIPSVWPKDSRFDDDPDGAIELFKSIKRKYYFENTNSNVLSDLQKLVLDKGRKTIKEFDYTKKELKYSIIKGLNRLFFPSSSERRKLQIWTTHKYDLSIESSTVVSCKYMDANKLEIVLPRPIDWLTDMEYTPNHIILRPKTKKCDKLYLTLDVDFLRILSWVEKGYPTALLPSHYEQTVSKFLQRLDENGLADENDEEEIVVANRKNGSQMKILVENNKYNFE